MGAFDRLVLFPEVSGVVLKDGKPVVGAELVQKAVWSLREDKNPVQRTITGADGAFRFPAIQRAAWLRRLIASQPMVHQTITIRDEGVEYLAWMHGKDSYDPNTELDGKRLNLMCELTRSPEMEGTHYGIGMPC
ncbi:carboxypeptidase-like regulatory domain-containing protein [Trinickia acidisoli]|uniref:DUF6795 domain-containing protein n=1 Tax=Trinickia acidisoli TaxID=2767482 RepID=UPI001A8D2B53|nr:carboxypeptidase-like regulatory domain-containing protein [Trinickia acidisoli]